MAHGLPPETLEPGMEVYLYFLYGYLPKPPVCTAASLCCAAAADGADQVSRLPDDLLRRVVSLLPAKDGARTTVLSSRWRGIWPSAPLFLVDTHLLPGPDGERPRRPARAGPASLTVTNAVSAVLESHPGPFPFASISCSFMVQADAPLLARWFQLLATKGVHELVLVNRPFPIPGLRLPPAIFFSCCASLRRLCIGAWVLPDTAALPRVVAFPNLRQLFLNFVAIEHDNDLDFLLAVSPVLEILTVAGCVTPLRARLASHSLRSAQFCLSTMKEIAVVDAPNLQRLYLWKNWNERHGRNIKTTVRIGNFAKLRVLGYLEPGVHLLQIGNTIIEAGTKASMHSTVPSIQMLAVQLQFAFCNEVEMLPSFLRCFPGVETLVVESRAHRETLDNIDLKIWQQANPIECVQLHLRTLAFHELQGKHNEFDFLKFIAENAWKLERMFIVIKSELTYAERQVVVAGVCALYSAHWASRDCNVQYKISGSPVGCSSWSFPAGSELSLDDPFEVFCEA